MTSGFPDSVRTKFATLLEDYGFSVSEENHHRVTLLSDSLQCDVTFDPRGELDVSLSLQHTKPWTGWQYVGIVGRASVERLLEIALASMQDDPRLLSGDPFLFAAIANERRAEAVRQTAKAEGKDVPTRRPRLP